MERLEIRIEPQELLVGNRTKGVRAGVVFPEAGMSWLDEEIESLPTRSQDKFNVRKEDIDCFRREIYPYWKGKTLEDTIYQAMGEEIAAVGKVAKINQKDHAQGHICPNTAEWLALGPAGILKKVRQQKALRDKDAAGFYKSLEIVLEGASRFMLRYAELAQKTAEEQNNADTAASLKEVSRICRKLAAGAPETFHEAVQSLWFLFVLLHLESNASSFSPGRADQYLYPYWKKDMEAGRLDLASSLELIEALWIKFNQIVYLRNSHSAKYFAGFPIGFNIAIGGQSLDGCDAANELSFLMLKAQEDIGLPQPNLSARLFAGSGDLFIDACSRVIGKGSGMPQVFNDESVIPALENQGISHEDAVNYAIVGCVELTTHGNSLGWSDAAMFNLVKALELTLNNGVCLLTGKPMGLALGYLTDYQTYEDLEDAFRKQLDFFIDKMIRLCDRVDRCHARILPSAFLSSVVDDCVTKGLDVTGGGAHYNLSGIQAIQVANLSDSLAVLKQGVYTDKSISREELLRAISDNWKGMELLRARVINKFPKYGNNTRWVDDLGNVWIEYFTRKLGAYTNARGGRYHAGLYTVSAHIPMGQNVGAGVDGRMAQDPLADGGMSAMYGRDISGPTALLNSVSHINSAFGSNGTLLNMKFLPDLFKTREGIKKFSAMLKAFVGLHINHVQFNVLRKEDLLAARENPQLYSGLAVRVAGYTAYFTELAGDLQDEIIARTSYTDI
jgi:formate C-acetyltransferase